MPPPLNSFPLFTGQAISLPHIPLAGHPPRFNYSSAPETLVDRLTESFLPRLD